MTILKKPTKAEQKKMDIEELKDRLKHNSDLAEQYPEKVWIVCAANYYAKRDIVIPSGRHFDIRMHLLITELDIKEVPSQGFMDNYGRFHTREEAYQIAYKNGQIRFPEHGGMEGLLFSEMLY